MSNFAELAYGDLDEVHYILCHGNKLEANEVAAALANLICKYQSLERAHESLAKSVTNLSRTVAGIS
jgi:hypothetical protein